jgi:hypothetical protein
MHFKSAQNPALVVFSSSGMECQLFVLKNTGRDIEKSASTLPAKSPKRAA